MTDQVNGTIFNKAEDQAASSDQSNNSQQEQQQDPLAALNSKLSSIVNEKGEQKYANIEVALQALQSSQEHIKTLESENKLLKDTKTESDTFEEALKQLSAQGTNDQTKSEVMDAETIKQLAQQAYAENKSKELANSNTQLVSDTLVKSFGSVEKAVEAYEAKAKELGVPVQVMNNLAETAPQAVLEYFSVKPTSTSASQGTINSEALDTGKQNPDNFVPKCLQPSSPEISAWREIAEMYK